MPKKVTAGYPNVNDNTDDTRPRPVLASDAPDDAMSVDESDMEPKSAHGAIDTSASTDPEARFTNGTAPPPLETDGPSADDGQEPTDKSKAAPSGDGNYTSKARSFRRFRLDQNFDEVAGVSKVLVHVSRLKPSPQSWFRVHPDESYRMPVALLVLKDERSEPYLVAPEIVAEMSAETSPHLLVTYVTRQGAVGLWPLRLPRSDGKSDNWMRTAHEGAKLGTTRWVRLTANLSNGAYDVQVTSADLPEPEWPDTAFEKLIEIAYRENIIESLDHPVLRRLRGEI